MDPPWPGPGAGPGPGEGAGRAKVRYMCPGCGILRTPRAGWYTNIYPVPAGTIYQVVCRPPGPTGILPPGTREELEVTSVGPGGKKRGTRLVC